MPCYAHRARPTSWRKPIESVRTGDRERRNGRRAVAANLSTCRHRICAKPPLVSFMCTDKFLNVHPPIGADSNDQ
jgi:hypothetical protein